MMNHYWKIIVALSTIARKYFEVVNIIQYEEDEFLLNLVDSDEEGNLYPDLGVVDILYNHLSKKFPSMGEYSIERQWIPGENYKDVVGIRVIVK